MTIYHKMGKDGILDLDMWYNPPRPRKEGESMESISTNVRTKLETLKKTHSNGSEYWMAREIQPILGYSKWENFKAVVGKAKMACESTGVDPIDHFLDARKVVPSGSSAEIEREDCFLSRYACYLVAMNGDSRKPEIGTAQTYFAIQTRRQERFDELTEAQKRIELRERVKDHNKQLNIAAKQAGVQTGKFGLFHDAGYRGLYGLGYRDIKRKKNIPDNHALLDYAGRAELASNDFRITQTEEKLKLENIQGQKAATEAHREVGQEVRATIEKIGGTMPEDLTPEIPIKKLEAKQKKAKALTE